ncbi:MAG: hypothetical protein AAGJ94_17665, partial [Pseudomonadota bacterium]
NEALMDGLRTVSDLPRGRPDPDAFSFFTIENARHVVVRKLTFTNCLPTAIRIKNSQHVAIERCVFSRASYAIAAGTHGEVDETQYLLIDNCRSIQDPDQNLWRGRVSWHSVKQQALKQEDARHYNGSFFKCFCIRGDVMIRRTNVAHTFNGVNFWNKEDTLDRHHNIFITGCRFAFIRDNAIEPEWRVDNLWVVNNSFYNCHNPFSMDHVEGHHRYYFGNTILNRVRPGALTDANRGGKIFKFTPSEYPPTPIGEFYTAYNAVLTRTAYLKGGRTQHWTHANNAISVQRDGPHTSPHTPLAPADFLIDATFNIGGDITDTAPLAAESQFTNSFRRINAPLFEPPVLRADFAGTTDEWDGQLTLAGVARHERTVAVNVALADGSTVTVPRGEHYGAGTPTTLMDAFKAQSSYFWKTPPPALG